jgi:hypothetical protein
MLLPSATAATEVDVEGADVATSGTAAATEGAEEVGKLFGIERKEVASEPLSGGLGRPLDISSQPADSREAP